MTAERLNIMAAAAQNAPTISPMLEAMGAAFQRMGDASDGIDRVLLGREPTEVEREAFARADEVCEAMVDALRCWPAADHAEIMAKALALDVCGDNDEPAIRANWQAIVADFARLAVAK